jgi:hypothetical protein
MEDGIFRRSLVVFMRKTSQICATVVLHLGSVGRAPERKREKERVFLIKVSWLSDEGAKNLLIRDTPLAC